MQHNEPRDPSAEPIAPDAALTDDAAPPGAAVVYGGAAAAIPIPATPLAPVSSDERIEIVDALRGVALLGILTVNMAYHGGPFAAEYLPEPLWPAAHDRIAAFAIHWLAEGKFYTLFSLLFGFGMATQLARADARGAGFTGRYCRRLLVLLGFGLAHGLLIWAGDILAMYALLGFVLLAFARRKDATLLVWSGALVALHVVTMFGLVGLLMLAHLAASNDAQAAAEMTRALEDVQRGVRESMEVYGHGTYVETLPRRLADYATGFWLLALSSPSILAMFLLGVYVARRGLLTAAHATGGVVVWLSTWGLALGLAANFGYAWLLEGASILKPNAGLLGALVLVVLGSPLLCLAYAAVLTRLYYAGWRPGLFAALASAGRMALTNYLMQSIICALIFGGYQPVEKGP